MDRTVFTKSLPFDDIILHEHVYNIKSPVFYFCKEHKHKHKTNPNVDCIIQTIRCCSKAISIRDYTKCFIVTVANSVPSKKPSEYVIFDPSIWKDQSTNHFMSFIRAVISTPSSALERYKRFESSNFAISNIKKYKSGKESIIRTAVTGFQTKGLYQTATISCIIPYYTIIMPQQLYDMLKADNYDLDLVCVKRDPSILPTCMYVCQVERNPDPTISVLITSDQQSKGRNQDQDGDKNAVNLLRRTVNDYDASNSYKYLLAKMEMAAAFRTKLTLLSTPRYIFSETTLLILERYRDELIERSPFYARTYKYGPKFMNDACAGYLQDEHDEFQGLLIEICQRNDSKYVTTDDILLKTSRLPSIIQSKAKGNKDLLDMLLANISTTRTLNDCKKDMIDLCNKYITSSQDLSRNGRKQFTALYAAHDLVSFMGHIYMNKVPYADYTSFASVGTLLFSEASLKLFVDDLEAL